MNITIAYHFLNLIKKQAEKYIYFTIFTHFFTVLNIFNRVLNILVFKTGNVK